MTRRRISPLSLCLFMDYAGMDLNHQGSQPEPTTQSASMVVDDAHDEHADIGADVDAVPDVEAAPAVELDTVSEPPALLPTEEVYAPRRLRPNGKSDAQRVDPDAGLGPVAARERRKADVGKHYPIVRLMVTKEVTSRRLNVDIDDVVQEIVVNYIETGKVWDPSKSSFKTLMQWAMKAQLRNCARRYTAEAKVMDRNTTERMIAASDALDKEFSVGDMPMKGSSCASASSSPISESSRAAAYSGEHGAIERITARRQLDALAHVAESSVSLTTLLSRHHPAYVPDDGVLAANARQQRTIGATGATMAAMTRAAVERGVSAPTVRDPYIIVATATAAAKAPEMLDQGAAANAPTAAVRIEHLTTTGEPLGGRSKRRAREVGADVDVGESTFVVPIVDADATGDDDARWRASVDAVMPPVVRLRSTIRRRPAIEQP